MEFCKCADVCEPLTGLAIPSNQLNPGGPQSKEALDLGVYERLCDRTEAIAEQRNCRRIEVVRAQIK